MIEHFRLEVGFVTDGGKLDEALGLFPSAIKCGENWSPTCQAVLDAAKAELNALRTKPLAPLSGARYRHKVRGSTYRILFEAAKASSIVSALDDMTMVVYQCEADGLVWVRPALEFFDGRFECLSSELASHDGVAT